MKYVVDDEKVIAEALTTILQNSGFAAKYFTDAQKALDAARIQAPELILSDVMMPSLLAVELAIAIQQECPGCKIMPFSGHAHTVDLMSLARAKGYDFNLLVKPLHPADLLRRVRRQDPARALGAI